MSAHADNPLPPPATPAARVPNHLAALGWMLLASLLFALMNVLGRIAGTHHVPWPMIGLARAAAGLVVSLIVVQTTGAAVLFRGSRALWMRSLFGAGGMVTTFYVLGSAGIALGDAVTLFNLMPVFVAVIAPLALRERSGSRLIVALPLALAGVLLVVQPPMLSMVFGAPAAPTDPRAVVASLAAALFSSIAMIGLRRVGPRESAQSITVHFSMVSTAVMLAFAIPVFVVPSGRDALVMLGAGVAAGLAQLALTKAYTLERAALVASYGYANVIFTALLAAIVLGELPDGIATIGMVLVLGAGLLVTATAGRDAAAVRDAAPPAK